MKNFDDILDSRSIYRAQLGNHHASGERRPKCPHARPARLVERVNEEQAHPAEGLRLLVQFRARGRNHSRRDNQMILASRWQFKKVGC